MTIMMTGDMDTGRAMDMAMTIMMTGGMDTGMDTGTGMGMDTTTMTNDCMVRFDGNHMISVILHHGFPPGQIARKS